MVNRRWPLALRASGRSWAIGAGIRGALAAGLIAGLGVITGDIDIVGVMYFGAACSVAFATGITTRIRLIGVASQATGAAAGLLIGALSAPTPLVMVGVAAVAAFCSGAVGRIGVQSAAFATMLVIGVAFAQFSGTSLPWTEQIGWYCAGSVIVGLATLPALGPRRLREERAAIAGVFRAAADLMAAAGSPSAGQARTGLAAASAAARSAWYDNRFRATFEQAPRYRDVARQMRAAEAVALVAATDYRIGAPPAAATIEALRDQAVRLTSAALSFSDPAPLRALTERHPTSVIGLTRVRHTGLSGAAAVLTAGPSLVAGARLAICMTIATGTTLLLHDPAHSFWLPLTVAVVVRPEYASVYVRTLNRMVGTLIGASIATVPLLLFGSGWPIAVSAALAVGFAAAAAPKLYGLSVIGITCSALLSTSIAVADPVAPIFRLMDTLIGCVIAMVFGYLLWPDRWRTPDGIDPAEAVDAALDYLHAVEFGTMQPGQRAVLGAQDRAYRSAHRFRAAAQSALADPMPIHARGAALLPEAIRLEDLVDDISALAEKPNGPDRTSETVRRIRDQLPQLNRSR